MALPTPPVSSGEAPTQAPLVTPSSPDLPDDPDDDAPPATHVEPDDIIDFRDSTFESVVKRFMGRVDSGGITKAEAAEITRLEIDRHYITSLSGIEYFTALTVLKCHNNSLTEIDVSKNTKLVELSVTFNELSELDVSNNTKLQVLRAGSNQLAELDVSNNTELMELQVGNNQLTQLDVSGNTALDTLDIRGNNLPNRDALTGIDPRKASVAFYPQTSTGQALETVTVQARGEILCALNKGFVPDDLQGNYSSAITRQEFCKMAVMFMEYALGKTIDEILSERGLTRDSEAFSDTSDPYILAAFALSLTGGTRAPTDTQPGIFTPDGRFSRQEAATMLTRICEAIGMDTGDPPASDFIDINAVAGWARDSVNFVRAYDIMDSTSSARPTFSPGGTLTRQESIIAFNRFGPASEIKKIINDRGVVGKAFLWHISSDLELVSMLDRYNELQCVLYDFYLSKGTGVITYVATAEGFGEDVDFSGEWNIPPYYPFTPDEVADAATRIARNSLYSDFERRFYDDPVIYPLLKKEGGGSAGMWPDYWGPQYISAPPEVKNEELAEWRRNHISQMEEYLELVDNILMWLDAYLSN